MAIKETTINRFDGGIVTDPRDPNENTCQMVSNFDIHTNPRKMTPYRSTEDGDDAGTTSRKQNFCIALRSATQPGTYSLYGLGNVSGDTTLAEVLYKNLTQGSATDLDDNAWTNTANNQHSGANRQVTFNLFAFYLNRALIYFYNSGSSNRGIWSYDPTGSVAMAAEGGDASTFATAGTIVTQGLVHSQDDKFYVGYALTGGTPAANILVKDAATAWDTVFANNITGYFITSLCEYGNYLAFALVPTSGIGNSRVILWDRTNVGTAAFNEVIDWGDGQLNILEVVDGELIGISQVGGSRTSFSVGEGSTLNSGTNIQKRLNDRVIFRRYIGGRTAVKFKEIIADHASVAGTTQLPIAKQIVNGRLHFLMLVEMNGSVRDGIWSIGKNKTTGEFVLSLERPTQSSVLTLATGILNSFIIVGDFAVVSYQGGGSYIISKTAEGSTYTTASIYESKRFNAGDASKKKDLLGVTVTTEFLPAAGQVILAYRTDQNTSWTTIFTNTTDNSISNSVSSQSGLLPRDYKEIEFRIESTGGAEITGLSFREEVKETRQY